MLKDPYSHYIERVLEEEDRILLIEAINSAKAGALRASYIMVWLSAAESIKRKFKTLAVQDDQAGQIVGEINRKEAQQQAIDKFLLTKGKEYGFLSDSEFCRLEHIYDMRSIYGHPYEEGPNKESLVAAIADVVQIVLEQPVKLRHRFIHSQVELLGSSPSFLDDLQVSVSRYVQETYLKIDSNLHTYIITELWKKIEPIIEDASLAHFHRRAIWFTRAYLSVDPPSVLARWNLVDPITRWPTIASLSLGDPELWPYLSEHPQDIIVGELLSSGASRGDCLKTLELLHESGVLNQRQSERFTVAVGSKDSAYLMSAGVHLKHFSSAIIHDLKSHHWYTQNPAITVLANAGPAQIASLPEQVQWELGNNVLQSADGGAHEANRLLGDIGSSAEEWPPEFLFGILLECFVNDDNEVRLKIDKLGSAIRSLNSTRPDIAESIIGRVCNAMRDGDTEFLHISSKRFQETLNFLDRLSVELEFPTDQLKAALRDLKDKE